ncbi:MAG: FadR family transcriptional regulator [Solirubrobacterales bacterium]|nr:FadR family transcriptional regulator [Solirubrobacterales bacterium]
MAISSEPFRAVQVHEQVAQRLLADVRAGRLPSGERLPSERDLARGLEVSRASVREAIGLLQVVGIVETRPGSGSYVTREAHRRAEATEASALQAHEAGPSALLDAREAFEPAVAAMAALRARPDPDAERILAEMDRLSDPASPSELAAWSEGDRRFHRRIGVMTGNPVVMALCDQLATMMDQPFWRRLRDDSLTDPGRMRLHGAEHRMIYEAIVAGDPAAEMFAREHLRRVRRYMALSGPTEEGAP